MMDMLIFRNAEPSDSTAIAALHTASWRSAYRGLLPDTYLDGLLADQHQQLWYDRLRQPRASRRYVLLAEQNQQLLGFACALMDVEPGWGVCLDNLHVHPTYKRSGIGRQLFAHTANWVIQHAPIWPLYLWVLEENTAARRFYDRYGGEMVERTTKTMSEGVTTIVLRYIWRDLDQLARDLQDETAT